jgi:hypothetical protein
MSGLSRSRACRAAVLAAGSAAVVWLGGAVLLDSAGARAATPPTKVTATIEDSRIAFAPSYVPTGKVVLTVLNRTKGARDFGVGTRRTDAIAAGRSARLTVTLPTKGERTFSSVAKGERARRLTGALYLIEPCAQPATTTVDVNIAKSAGGLTLSQSSVPCGTVTFVVTDVDSPGTSLLVSVDTPPLSSVTDQLNPGGTATLTVPFAAKAVVHCDAVQNDSVGDSVVVGSASLTLS